MYYLSEVHYRSVLCQCLLVVGLGLLGLGLLGLVISIRIGRVKVVRVKVVSVKVVRVKLFWLGFILSQGVVVARVHFEHLTNQ